MLTFIVRSKEDLTSDKTTFHPSFTHQIFGQDEIIIGYKKPRIDLYYNSSTLYCYLNMSHAGNILADDEITPIDMLTKIPIRWSREAEPIQHTFTQSLDEFQAVRIRMLYVLPCYSTLMTNIRPLVSKCPCIQWRIPRMKFSGYVFSVSHSEVFHLGCQGQRLSCSNPNLFPL